MPGLPAREPLEGRQPRVLAHVHCYLPHHNAGAERMLHVLLRALVRAGWDARAVVSTYRGEPYDYEGVLVEGIATDEEVGERFAWCDVAVTHLHTTSWASAWARWGRPLVHLIHNHRQIDRHEIQPDQAQLIVWNAEWLVRPEWSPSIIVRPPTYLDEFETVNPRRFEDGAVTLVNLDEAKGGSLFWRLGEARRDLPFLGVMGAYGLQEAPVMAGTNCEVVDNTPNIRPLYERTRVLVVPSTYESWGKAAVEALCSGIPVIASPTEGLLESLTSPQFGPCAIFCDPHDQPAWEKALRSLDDRAQWQMWSDKARARAIELDAIHRAEVGEWVDTMTGLLSHVEVAV